MTISEALSWAIDKLRGNEVDAPESSAEFLLRQVLGKDRAFLLTHPEHELTSAQQLKYEKYISRRFGHEPVWYITGKIEFLGLDIAVNENVLIPRPETELLVEKILEYVRGGFAPKKVLDVGTGSGAIVLALANTINYQQSTINKNVTSLRGARGDAAISFAASDISREALSVAKKNAKSLGLDDKITFKQGDLFDPWQGEAFELIVTNLPYIPHEDMATLALDLIHYEPRTALDGGHEGLEIYQRFFDGLAEHLEPGGMAFCEIGYDQGEKIQKYLANALPHAKVSVLGDYADIDRIVIIEV